jgi:hypothetical protein
MRQLADAESKGLRETTFRKGTDCKLQIIIYLNKHTRSLLQQRWPYSCTNLVSECVFKTFAW